MAYELGILLKKWIISWIFLDIIYYLCTYYVLDLEVQNRIFLSRSYSQYPAWILQLKKFFAILLLLASAGENAVVFNSSITILYC